MLARPDPNDVASWAATLALATRRQYRPIVERLVRRFGPATRSATREELRAFISSLPGESYQGKAVSAIASFYGFLVDEGYVRPDPTRGLGKAVRAAQAGSELERAVAEACGPEALDALRWRDVGSLLIGAGDPAGIARVEQPHRGVLLGRARGIIGDGDVEDVADRCAMRVFRPDGGDANP